ncbi:MAG: hypothetical protein KFB97_06640 [Cyanobium sp. M30B3]|nr:MAG: hypothetical protein KFB97_06640 [Cyanobium sp. M30B3]
MLLVVIGRCFVAAYLIAVASAVFPLRLTDLGWQQQVLDAFVNIGSVPIIGRVFILLAIAYKGYDLVGMSEDPNAEDELSVTPARGLFAKRKIARLVRRLQIFLFAAMRFLKIYLPSLLFVLVAVLQIYVSARYFRALDVGLLNQTSALTQQATQIRAAIAGLNDRDVLLQAIQGLVPEGEREELISLPVDQQKSEIAQRINQRESSIRVDFEQQRSQRFLSLIVRTVKNVLISLLFALCLYWLRPAAVRAFIRGVE